MAQQMLEKMVERKETGAVNKRYPEEKGIWKRNAGLKSVGKKKNEWLINIMKNKRLERG